MKRLVPARMGARLLAGLLAGVLAACGTSGGGGNVASNSGLRGQTTELKTASDLTSADKRASIRLQLAVGYYQEGTYEVALDEIKQALAADPNLADAYGVRALIYTAMNENALAEENYQRAIRLAPRNADFNNNYGRFLCQTRRYELGMAQFETALANQYYQSPSKAKANAGNCAMQMKNLAVAERYLLDALRVEPDLPVLQADLARVYYERRDYPRAGFFINRLTTVAKPDTMPADWLWLAMRVQRKLGEKAMEQSLGTQLRRRHPLSPEFAAYQRGAFDE